MPIKTISLLSLVLMAFIQVHGQLCQGSLGDPIVNITFGAGANPGNPLSAATTNYSFSFTDCPDDGNYTIRNQTTACFRNTWHTVNSDHTGDVNGYFMLINASYQPSAFYLDTVKGLCANTTYEFAAWILNVIQPSSCNGNTIQPNLTFRIETTDGTILQTYNSANIPPSAAPLWKQYGFFFTTPQNVSNIVLRIINNSSGGCGNDLALDDITFRPCGPIINANFTGLTGLVKNICKDDSVAITMNCSLSAGFNNPVYQWQISSDGMVYTNVAGANSLSLTQLFLPASNNGNYFYRMAVYESNNQGIAACKVYSPVLKVAVELQLSPAITSNAPVCQGTTLQMYAKGGSSYAWTGPNGFTASGSSVSIQPVQPGNAGKYKVFVTTPAGCFGTDSAVVAVNPAPVAATTFSDSTICAGSTIRFSATGGGSYQWTPGTGLSSAVSANPAALPVQSTVYQVLVSNAFNCTDSTTIAIIVLIPPAVNAGSDAAILQGQSVQLKASVSANALSYAWSPPWYMNNVTSLSPVVNPPNDTSYVLRVVSAGGCGIFSDTVRVRVYKKVIVPNAFSPNGDGINDVWRILALDTYNSFELSVFNRSGHLVFFTNNYRHMWDGTYQGKPLPVGVYYYLLNFKVNVLPLLSGSVILLR